MKLGVVGKGGTGKTTLSTLVCVAYAGRGKRVVAVDTDSNPNLALSLGLGEATAARARLVPRALADGSRRVEGDMTPARLIRDYGLVAPSGVVLLHAMRIEAAGAGCSCASHASVRSLLATAIDEEVDLALVDMEAGLEHLSRSGGTLAYADLLLMVMEPTRKSVVTAARTLALAHELGIPRIAGVGNKARHAGDHEFFAEVCIEYGIELAGVVPFDPAIAAADRLGTWAGVPDGPAGRAIEAIVDFVESPEAQREALLAEKARIERRLAELGATA
ncbi:MAG: AAA family ATPase [Acidimicrobiales bacterium]